MFGPASVLGTVTTRDVRFNEDGESGLVPFEIKGRKNPPAVGAYDVGWLWQRRRGGRWVDCVRTNHRLFILAAVPAHPWGRATEAKAERVPWPAAFELACQWASGATSVEESTDMIVKAINEHPKHIYDPLASEFASNKDNFFDLTHYMHQLTTAPVVRIDCRGTAAAVATFANLLGAELYPLVIKNSDGTFMTTKDFFPFTGPDWTQFSNWAFHEVAAVPGLIPAPVLPLSTFTPGIPWPPGFGEDQVIHDAISHLDRAAPRPARGIPVGVTGAGGHDYRFLLIDAGTGDVLKPELRRNVI